MDADPDKIHLTIYGLAVLAAIPLVMFALWADYFGRRLEQRRQESDSTNDEEIDLGLESFRIRVSGFTVMVFELMLFLGASELRKSHSVPVDLMFVAVLLIQSWMQAGLDKKAREPRKAGSKPLQPDRAAQTRPEELRPRPQEPRSNELKPSSIARRATAPQDYLWSGIRVFFWIFLSTAAYVTFVIFCAQSSAVLAVALHLGKAASLAVISTGALIGLVGGLASNFALGPVHLRRVLKTRPMEKEYPESASEIRACFERSGVRAPSLWIVDFEHSKAAAAFVSGFSWGRGPFKPALFASQSLLESLSKEELNAVMLHEISHLRLKHLRKRFSLSAALVAGLTVCGVATLIIGQWLFSGQAPLVRELLGPAVAIAAFIWAFRVLGLQSRRHETEADFFAVRTLNAQLADLTSALRKLDKLNGIRSDKPGAGHPATELRISLLEAGFSKELLDAIARSKAQSGDSDHKDKAA